MPPRWFYASVLSLVLAACGGGEDSSPQSGSGTNTPPTINNPPSSGANSGSTPTDAQPPSSGDGSSGSGGNDSGSGDDDPVQDGNNSSGNGNNAEEVPTASSDWTFTDLSAVLPQRSVLKDLNNAGEIVGYYTLETGESPGSLDKVNAFLYHRGALTQLGSLGGTYTVANGINNQGDIVGSSSTNTTPITDGFVYRDDTMQSLSSLEGDFFGLHDINDVGQIVGDRNGVAVIFSNGQTAEIGTLPGMDQSVPYEINASGTVLGGSNVFGDPGQRSTFLFSQGTIQDLGSVSGCQSSTFHALNDAGQLAGSCDGRPVIKTGENLKEIGNISGHENLIVHDMNNAGQVVGAARAIGDNTDAGLSAYFYDGNTILNLNTVPSIASSGWKLQSAVHINDSGQILGFGTLNGNPAERYFLLTPVVE
jgi:probable HAF family extracellular repeat protein